jgi:hypothetical protein
VPKPTAPPIDQPQRATLVVLIHRFLRWRRVAKQLQRLPEEQTEDYIQARENIYKNLARYFAGRSKR